MIEFKIGDRVKQIKHIFSYENPFAIIKNIEGNRIFHIHEGSTQLTEAPKEDFIPAPKDEIIYE